MKIICIGRNYSEHARELKNEVPTEPVFFLKPDTALLRLNRPFFYPDFTRDLHYECEVVYRITKVGKCVAEKFAWTYATEVGLGIDFTARDLQDQAKAAGLPWEKAKAFDQSAVISPFIPIADMPVQDNLEFELWKNGEKVQQGNTSDMLFPVPKLIAYVSRFMTLRTGDLLFTGTPSGVGPVAIGDVLEGWLGGQKMFRCAIK